MPTRTSRRVARFSRRPRPLPRTSGFRGRSRAMPPSEVAARLSAARPLGISKWDLDTPALCVDLDKLEQNIAKMQAALKRYRPRHAAARQDAQERRHREAAAGRRRASASARAKLGEAEALVAQGVDRICMTTGNLSPSKIRRAMQLRKRSPHFIQAVDYEQNARDLSAAAQRSRRHRRRRHRRRGRHAQRHPAGRGRAGAGEAGRHAAEPEAARPAVVRRRRAAHHRLRDAQVNAR